MTVIGTARRHMPRIYKLGNVKNINKTDFIFDNRNLEFRI